MAKGLFSGAATIKAPAPKGRKPEVETVELSGMEKLAALDAAMKSIKALYEAEEAKVKGQMADHFIVKGTASQSRPENFKGIEGAAEGSCQLRLRSSASVLSEDEQVTLTKHAIPFIHNVKTPEAFLINPAYTNDMALLAKVEEALEGVDLPDDFLMKQEEVSVPVATEESITAVFAKPVIEAELLLPLVSTLAIRPAIKGDFWSILDSVMQPQPETVAA